MTTTNNLSRFNVEIPVETYYVVEVMRPAKTNAESIYGSLTIDELRTGDFNDFTWQRIKDAWHGSGEWNITDENGDEVE